METILIKNKFSNRLLQGHLWAFSNELTHIPKLDTGTVVNVKTEDGIALGMAFFNPNSLISLRLLHTDDEVDKEFFVRRISSADKLRQSALPNIKVYRAVFGESDLLPGLIIDRFEDYYAVQTLSAGMELLLPVITDAILTVFPEAKGIIEKNKSHNRILEGLEQREGVLWGDIPDKIISDIYGIRHNITLSEGQKTGWYIDQRENAAVIRPFCKDKSVLDCFCNQGNFALNASFAVAKSVTAVDVSEYAVRSARENAVLNGMNNIEFFVSDTADFLTKEAESGKKYDVIILDPPTFTTNKKSVPKALAAYHKLHKHSVRLLSEDGVLVTASCSRHILRDRFIETVQSAASKAARSLQLLHNGGQPLDHPILPLMPETEYLKFLIFRVI